MSAANPQVVATVISVTGVAFARSADGGVRRLSAGDTILEGETVFTLADGQVELAFSDGHHATILPSESYLVGPEAMIATSPGAGESAIAAAGEIDKVVQALEQGGDILEGLDPTAAGPGAGGGENGGNSFVRLLRITEDINPVGFRYPLNDIGPIEAPTEEGIPEEEGEPNNAPVAGSGSVNVSEEGLGGALPDASGNPDTTNAATQNGQISVSDPDGDAVTVTLSEPSESLTSGGQPITWTGDGTQTLTGSVGQTTIITITIDNDGNYTVTLLGPIDHEDQGEDGFSFDVGVNVSDGSLTSTGTLTVTVEDDSPDAAVGFSTLPVDSLVVDETLMGTNASANFADNFTTSGSSYGADGDGTISTSYALGISAPGADSGVNDTASGLDVLLYVEGGQVVGRAGGPAGAVVFVISVDASGNVTLDQQRAVVHDDPNDPDENTSPVTLSAANLVTLTATTTVTDNDGDTDSSSSTVNIGLAFAFEDDGPSLNTLAISASGEITHNETANIQTVARLTRTTSRPLRCLPPSRRSRPPRLARPRMLRRSASPARPITVRTAPAPPWSTAIA